jgi:predicted unusual protein kinase regulating ubiquinone biosynthesis (AarF/ABC1/UbiB family)
MKGIGPSPEEERHNKVALKPLTALPEELILFQRVLTLFRGLCTQHSVKINFIEQLAPFAVRAHPTAPAQSVRPHYTRRSPECCWVG